MNKDQIKGRAKEVEGNVKKNVGKAIGNKKLQGKGIAEESRGKVQKNVGDIKHKVAKKIDNA